MITVAVADLLDGLGHSCNPRTSIIVLRRSNERVASSSDAFKFDLVRYPSQAPTMAHGNRRTTTPSAQPWSSPRYASTTEPT